MCYRMMDKRSDAAQQGIESISTKPARAERAGSASGDAVVAKAGNKAYARFMVRLQEWMAKASKEETTP